MIIRLPYIANDVQYACPMTMPCHAEVIVGIYVVTPQFNVIQSLFEQTASVRGLYRTQFVSYCSEMTFGQLTFKTLPSSFITQTTVLGYNETIVTPFKLSVSLDTELSLVIVQSEKKTLQTVALQRYNATTLYISHYNS